MDYKTYFGFGLSAAASTRAPEPVAEFGPSMAATGGDYTFTVYAKNSPGRDCLNGFCMGWFITGPYWSLALIFVTSVSLWLRVGGGGEWMMMRRDYLVLSTSGRWAWSASNMSWVRFSDRKTSVWTEWRCTSCDWLLVRKDKSTYLHVCKNCREKFIRMNHWWICSTKK